MNEPAADAPPTDAPPPAAVSAPSFAIPNPMSVLAGAAIFGGGLLPWWTIPGDSISAWDIPAMFLISESTGDGLKVGPLLLVGMLMLLPLLTKKPLPHIAQALVAAMAINASGLAIVRGLSNDVGIGVGLLITLAGGVLVGFGWFQGRRAVAAPRART